MAEEELINQEEQHTEKVEETKDKKTQQETVKKDKKKEKKDKIQEEINELRNQLADVKDKHVRLQAEFDNYRKRTLKEKMELMKSAGESVLSNILPIIDDFERALTAFQNVDNDNPLKEGVQLIYNKFQDFLTQNGIKEIDAAQKDFNTDLHEAVTKIPAPSEELKGKVIDVIQKGYLLNEKVIRFAKVVVGE